MQPACPSGTGVADAASTKVDPNGSEPAAPFADRTEADAALEGWIQAHERVLQVLTAYMARGSSNRCAWPGMNTTTAKPTPKRKMSSAPHCSSETRAPKPKETEMIDKHPVTPRRGGEKTLPMDRPARQAGVQVRERSGIWEVKLNGKFRGDYHRKEHALAAAALHKSPPR